MTASARAIATRWRWPPENSRGQRLRDSRRQADPVEQVRDIARPLRPSRSARGRAAGSAIASPTVIRGLSEEYGSWKTIWIERRTARSSLASAASTSIAVEDRPCPPRARRAGRCSGRASSCRCPTRRRSRASRPAPPRTTTSSSAVSDRRAAGGATWSRRACALGEPLRQARRPRAAARRGAHATSPSTNGQAVPCSADRVEGSIGTAAHSVARERAAGWNGQPAGRSARSAAGRGSAAADRGRGSRRCEGSPRAGRGCTDGAGCADRRPGRPRARPGVHDRDLVAGLGDHPEVVRDEDDRHPGLVLELRQQGQDLVLDRDVERGRRLVGEQQLGSHGDRDRDHHPLAHAAAELVRVRAQPPLGDGMPTRSSSSTARSARVPRRHARRVSRASRRSGRRP